VLARLVSVWAALSFGAALAAQPVLSKVAVVPFALDHNRMIVEVELVRPDGAARRAAAWVDTGQVGLGLAETLARDLGLDLSGFADAPAGEAVQTTSPTPEVRLGGLPLDPTGVATRVARGNRAIAGVPAEVHLPAALFRGYVVLFDYPANRLTLARPGVLKPRGEGLPCRINPETGLFLVEAHVAGERLSLGVDNGSSGTWISRSLTDRWEKEHPEWPRATGAAGCANFFGFPFEAAGELVRVPEVRIGTRRVRGVAALGLPQGLFDWYSKKSAGPVVGFLGADVLRGFRLAVDFPGQMTYWEAVGRRGTHDLDLVGLTLRPENDGTFTVAGVVERRGAPVVAGLQAGDRLLRVGALEVTGATMGAVVDALRGRPGALKRLEIERGGNRLTVEAPVTRLP